MHITCAHRRHGCPFILKLTRAKEGGWLLKAPQVAPGEGTPLQKTRHEETCTSSCKCSPADHLLAPPRTADPKARSNYTCDHKPGSTPDAAPILTPQRTAVPAGSTTAKILAAQAAAAAAGGGPAVYTLPGYVEKPDVDHGAAAKGKSKKKGAVAKRVASGRKDSPALSAGGFEDQSDAAGGKQVPSTQNRKDSVKGRNSTSQAGGSMQKVKASTTGKEDRALAPPFERSLSLQAQIAPALSYERTQMHGGGAHYAGEAGLNGRASSFVPSGLSVSSTYRDSSRPLASPAWPTTPAAYRPRTLMPYPAHQQPHHTLHSPSTASTSAQPHQPQESYLPSYRHILVAPPPQPPTAPRPSLLPKSSSLEAWTTYLTALDPTLVDFAPILAAPTMALSPESFFAESEEMRMALIEVLEVEQVGVWPRLRLKSRIKERGEKVWKEVVAARESGVEAMKGVELEKEVVEEVMKEVNIVEAPKEVAPAAITAPQAPAAIARVAAPPAAVADAEVIPPPSKKIKMLDRVQTSLDTKQAAASPSPMPDLFPLPSTSTSVVVAAQPKEAGNSKATVNSNGAPPSSPHSSAMDISASDGDDDSSLLLSLEAIKTLCATLLPDGQTLRQFDPLFMSRMNAAELRLSRAEAREVIKADEAFRAFERSADHKDMEEHYAFKGFLMAYEDASETVMTRHRLLGFLNSAPIDDDELIITSADPSDSTSHASPLHRRPLPAIPVSTLGPSYGSVSPHIPPSQAEIRRAEDFALKAAAAVKAKRPRSPTPPPVYPNVQPKAHGASTRYSPTPPPPPPPPPAPVESAGDKVRRELANRHVPKAQGTPIFPSTGPPTSSNNRYAPTSSSSSSSGTPNGGRASYAPRASVDPSIRISGGPGGREQGGGAGGGGGSRQRSRGSGANASALPDDRDRYGGIPGLGGPEPSASSGSGSGSAWRGGGGRQGGSGGSSGRW